MSRSDDNKLLEEVPASMQKLARYVARGFYGVEYGIVMDLLIRNVCMLEEPLRKLLRFDPKQLRTILIFLKNDKVIKERQYVESRSDSRPVKHNYYFINYRALINVLKYKVDHMRKKLESEEKTTTHRAMYKCTRCQKSFTDLDIGTLWNGEELECDFCRSLVVEDASVGPNTTTRSSLARFNEQLWPFLQLLQELEGCQLAPHLLEPTPKILPEDTEGGAFGAGGSGASDGHSESRGKEYDLYKQGFTVNIEGTDDGAGVSTSAAPKEVPVWMQTSTVAGAAADSIPEDHVAAFTLGSTPVVDNLTFKQQQQQQQQQNQQDIVQALLVHETKAPATSTTPVTVVEPSGTQQSSDEESEFEEVEEEELFVTVQGKQVSFSELTENPHLISQMTPDEKQHYIRISQQAFETLHG